MNYLDTNTIYHGRSEEIMRSIKPSSISLSFWSPPYFVGKEYEKNVSYESWKSMLREVIHNHYNILKPGGFLVINIADIRCFKDESIPKFQAMNLSLHRSKVTREMVLEAKEKFPNYNRYQLAAHLGCSEQTIDRRLNGNNIRGGKYETQTRVNLVGGFLQEYGLECGLYVYDHRIWIKDPAWANCKWTSNSLKAVDEYEDLYIFWKPGQQVINKSKLSTQEWREWGIRGTWYINSVRSNDDHEAKFPLELASRVIRLFSEKGDIVLDPFMGSGTTAIAAIRNKRCFIGIEKEKRYVQLATANIKAEYTTNPVNLFDSLGK
ncbi:DNA-methyltransferase [Bilophila wadsworthia]|uniref:DNA-methyltransferase n=2 Tax=Bilophila wadsworthia TaxID=35833 RepID=UPI001EDC351C|nr:site-specific DNA-methyltransferase [Bilophila wadsworthia]MCG4633096.1 site-specific DNA-methyltransferase [Bilophila wadsworthia]